MSVTRAKKSSEKKSSRLNKKQKKRGKKWFLNVKSRDLCRLSNFCVARLTARGTKENREERIGEREKKKKKNGEAKSLGFYALFIFSEKKATGKRTFLERCAKINGLCVNSWEIFG